MKIVKINGQIEILTGLHIGGGDDVMKIGGIDNPVVKNTNGVPYIPGSSIKGKMRSLLEWNYGLVGLEKKGKPFGSHVFDDKTQVIDDEQRKNAETLIKLFGDSNPKNSGDYGITRLSVSDCNLSEESKDLTLTEAKYENVINRRKGTAENPRQTERVAAGVKFDFDIKIKIIDDDNEEEFISAVKKGIELIESDYLGGSGSRGYGRVKFHIAEDKNETA
jgi:CRISPR-associated protein Csm3